VFDRNQDFLRPIGRKGQGPGEFQAVTAVAIAPGDSLVIVDTGNLRITVLTPNYEYARTLTVPVTGQQARVSPEGVVYVAGLFRSLENLGYPVHRLDADGSVRSLGAENPEFTPETRGRMRRVLALDRQGIWIGHALEYRIEMWEASGRMRTVVHRRADWFPRADRYGLDPDTNEPPALLQGVHVLDEDRLLTMINIPEEEWEEGIGTRETITGRQTEGVTDSEAVWRTRLEVLNLTEGRVVASLTVPQRMLGFVGNEPIAYGEGTVGDGIYPVINLWRVDFDQGFLKSLPSSQ
jgi:hypothetical protein